MREERNLNAAQSEEVANISDRHTGKNLAKATKVLQFISSSFHRNTAVRLGVGDIIEKIIESQYIGIFTTYQQVIVIEKNRFGNYQKIKKHSLIFSQIHI